MFDSSTIRSGTESGGTSGTGSLIVSPVSTRNLMGSVRPFTSGITSPLAAFFISFPLLTGCTSACPASRPWISTRMR